MLATIARVVDRFNETIAAMRAKIAAVVPSGVSPYRADYIHLSVPAPEYARLADQLAEATRVIHSVAEREAKLERRASDLSSSNGALMVDRDRGIREAGRRADGARKVAHDSVEALRAAGIEPGADLDTLIEDAARYDDMVFTLLDRERIRLDEFRCTMVGLIQQCQDHASAGKGLTPEQVGKLGRAIHRANNKACGR